MAREARRFDMTTRCVSCIILASRVNEMEWDLNTTRKRCDKLYLENCKLRAERADIALAPYRVRYPSAQETPPSDERQEELIIFPLPPQPDVNRGEVF